MLAPPRAALSSVWPSSVRICQARAASCAIDAGDGEARRARARSRRAAASGWHSRQTSRVTPPKRTLAKRRPCSLARSRSPRRECRDTSRALLGTGETPPPPPGRATRPPSFGGTRRCTSTSKPRGRQQGQAALGEARGSGSSRPRAPPFDAARGARAHGRRRRTTRGQRLVKASGDRAAARRRATRSSASARTMRAQIDVERRPLEAERIGLGRRCRRPAPRARWPPGPRS